MLCRKYFAYIALLMCGLVLGALLSAGGCKKKKQKHHDEREAAAIVSHGTGSWRETSTGPNSPCARMMHSAVWTGDRMIIWGGTDGDPTYEVLNNGASYNPDDDTWAPVSTGPGCPVARKNPFAFWTGTEMIIWGGGDWGFPLNNGSIYNPTTDSWREISNSGDYPDSRQCHTVVWTGTHMIVWGGTNDFLSLNSSLLNDGAVYDYGNDFWTSISTAGACPSGRCWHSAVWTGEEMIVWGGIVGSDPPPGPTNHYLGQDGGIFNPETNTWRTIAIDNGTPSARIKHLAVWTENRMLIWGGGPGLSGTPTMTPYGSIYDPQTDTWQQMAYSPFADPEVYYHTVLWTGEVMITAGGEYNSYYKAAICVYNPDSNFWHPGSKMTSIELHRAHHTAVWTGNSMIIWGGIWSNHTHFWDPPYNTGGIFTP